MEIAALADTQQRLFTSGRVLSGHQSQSDSKIASFAETAAHCPQRPIKHLRPMPSISGRRVGRKLTALIERRSKPSLIVSDHGTEFTSNAILAWSKDQKIE